MRRARTPLGVAADARGFVLMLCDRCWEVVTARFLDVEDVLGAPPSSAELSSVWLGEATSARCALDLVAALFEDTDAAVLRAQATARPGAGVDALARLASVLAQLATHGAQVDPQHVLRQVGLQHEMQLLSAELGEEGDRMRPRSVAHRRANGGDGA